MSSAVAELEAGLQAMLSLKPPGVSGSRIASVTALCTANIQSESVLVQKLFTHFRKAPGTHKLGVLYVIDSVTRKWLDQAKANGQTISSSAGDGTYAAGVNKVTELLPTLMNDIILNAPADQKEKIRKLVDIWSAGQTFPSHILVKFKSQLAEQQQKSTTPEGTPPRSFEASLGIGSSNPAPTADTSSILQALANMARQAPATVVPAPSNPASQGPHINAINQSNLYPQAAVNTPYSQSNVPAVNGSTSAPNFPQAQNNGQSQQSISQLPQYGTVPPSIAGLPIADPVLQQQLLVIESLAKGGVPQDQWPAILAALMAAAPVNGTAPPPLPVQPSSLNHVANGWNGMKQEDYRDRNSYQDNDNRFKRRSRSKSPQRAWNSRDSPQTRRNGYNHVDGGSGSPRGGYGDDRDRGRASDYRQRSPVGRRGRSPSPAKFDNRRSHIEKFVEFDSSIPEGSIKVLSRTLFVGGITHSTTESELQAIFGAFGEVQSVITNRDKRHAFVKMTNRPDADAAKNGMARDRSTSGVPYQVRWGVGFGPRDCCDYSAGVSIIPISKLTEADRKWMLTAEYGGTGGKPLRSGMVLEEPDIEIGQGVSSKAISRRNAGGRDQTASPPSRFRQPDRRRDDDRGNREWSGKDENMKGHSRENMNSTSGLQPGAGFPMPFSMPNGMPMLPPGFTFPGANFTQPPPPGRS